MISFRCITHLNKFWVINKLLKIEKNWEEVKENTLSRYLARKIVFKFFCVIFPIKVQSNEDVLKIYFFIIYVVNSNFSLDMH